MSTTEREQIDRLVSELVDEGSTAENVVQLENLLLGRPDLQDHYHRATMLHLLMEQECGGSIQNLQPLLTQQNGNQSDKSIASPAPCDTLVQQVSIDLAGTNRQRSTWVLASAIAAMVAVVASYAVLNFSGDEPATSGTATAVAKNEENLLPFKDKDSPASVPAKPLLVRDTRALQLLSRITRTSTPISIALPRHTLLHNPSNMPVSLCSGTAWMERTPGERERGYLVALPPGYRMDLCVDTDATRQNALGVAEIDKSGTMTGGTLSFNNLVNGDANSEERRFGGIGNYSEYNDSESTKYYLFAGSFLTEDAQGEEYWHQSDYSIQHNDRDILVIGWDDSGYASTPTEVVNGSLRDRDFNDMSAIIRFTGPEPAETPASEQVEFSPELSDDLEIASDTTTTGYIIDVLPNSKLVMAIGSSAVLQNSVRIIEESSRRILWQQDGISPSDSLTGYQEGHRGIYVIRNNSSRIQRYEVHVRYRPNDVEDQLQWKESPHKVLSNSDGGISVGFEDSPGVEGLLDWNDIRLHAHVFSD